MKKIVILILGLLVVSCSNDASVYNEFPTDTPLDSNTKISYTITQKHYTYPNINNKNEKLYFSGDKIVLHQKSDGTYSKYQYDNNLLSERQDFDSRNTPKSSTKFVYDNLGRIIQIDDMPFADKSIQNRKHVLVYDSNKITVTLSVSFPVSTKTYEFKLNSNNEIISYDFIKWNNEDVASNPKLFTYENGNLVKFGKSQISYSNIKNDYNYKKNVFGKEWKKNNFLINYLTSESFRLYMNQAEVSENLPSSSVEEYYSGLTYNTEVNYEFDSQNKMSKETRRYFFVVNGKIEDRERIEFVYEYN